MHIAAKLTKLVVDFGLVCLVVVALVYTLGALGGVLDGPDDIQAAQDTEAAFQDALTQAQAERPDLWNDERVARGRAAAGLVARADVAVGIVAKGVQP